MMRVEADFLHCLAPSLLAFLCLTTAALALDNDESDLASKPAARPTFVELDLSAEASTIRDRSGTISLTAGPFGGLDVSGLRVRLERTGSHYQYPDGRPGSASSTVLGNDLDDSALVGYESDGEALTVAVFAGWNQQVNSISQADPSNTTLGRHDGVKGLIEASYDVTERLTLEGSGELSQVNITWQADLKALYEIAMGLHLGPQVVFQGDAHYRQWKVGPYLSGLKIGTVTEFAVGAGVVVDARQGTGAYVLVENQLRF